LHVLPPERDFMNVPARAIPSLRMEQTYAIL
jgi:hypothetical protein